MSNNIMVKGMLAVAASLMFVLGMGVWDTAAEANEYDWDCIAQWQADRATGANYATLAVACFGADVNVINTPVGITLAETCFGAGDEAGQEEYARPGTPFTVNLECVDMWAAEYSIR